MQLHLYTFYLKIDRGMIMKLGILMMALLFTLGLTGCNTMSGAGKDIQKGGEKLEDSAEKNK